MALHEGTSPAGSLTTIFTPPCDIATVEDWSGTSCYPRGWSDYWFGNTGYYSPAICPSGYTIACSRYATAQGPDVEPTETAALCAPR
jgi:hypothetical protein